MDFFDALGLARGESWNGRRSQGIRTRARLASRSVWERVVKDTLNNAENYTVVESDDTKMTASYNVKHAAHVNVSGALLQRTNRVTLVPRGAECEMEVVSNYSGWEHNDRGDFKKRVDESLAKLQATTPAQPAKPEVPVK